jgi:hypothetical protein
MNSTSAADNASTRRRAIPIVEPGGKEGLKIELPESKESAKECERKD